MRTPLYPKILVEGRYAPRNDTNNLYDSLIDAPDSIDHPDIRWDPLDRCRCLHRIKCNVSGGAKIERSGGTVPQLTKTGIGLKMNLPIRGFVNRVALRWRRVFEQSTDMSNIVISVYPGESLSWHGSWRGKDWLRPARLQRATA